MSMRSHAPRLEIAHAGASIIFDGILDPGTAAAKTFSFRTPMKFEQEREGCSCSGSGSSGS